jgi:lysozyme
METYDATALRAELSRDEGRKPRIYIDTVGKTTGGVGRNLSDVPFSDDEIDLMLTNDIVRTTAALDKNLAWWRNLDPIRQRVIVNMAFNLGVAGLLTFTNTLAAIQRGDYSSAATGMLQSKWAVQVGARATRLSNMMRTGSV